MQPGALLLDASVWHGTLDRSREILAAHPEAASSDIFTAALLGDAAAVIRFLAGDPALATAKGGPRGWDALTYLCFSKFLRLEADRTPGFVEAATALLDAGADPNTGFFDESHRPEPAWECVLYGAAGVAHHPELTTLLLERGADPNDGEVAYHAPETLDNRALRVLVESGKLTQDSLGLMFARKLNWHDDDGVRWLLEHGVDPNWLLWGSRPLHYAVRHGVPLRYFEWLLDRGADPELADQNGTTPVAEAARHGRADVLELFDGRGVDVSLEGDDAFLAACARGNEAEAGRLQAADPALADRLRASSPGLLAEFAGAANVRAVALLLDLGFDPGAALEVATGRGRQAVAELLIARGADVNARRKNGQTPLGVAFQCLEQQSEWTPNEYSLPIAEALIAAGASIEEAGLTLTAAVCLGRRADAERLAISASVQDKQKALAAAAYNGRVGAIKQALALGADPNAPNMGLHPAALALHNAVCSGSLAAVRALVEAGAGVDGVDGPYQATALVWAEYYARESGGKEFGEIVSYLRDR